MRKGLYLGRKISHRKREGERDSEREREIMLQMGLKKRALANVV